MIKREGGGDFNTEMKKRLVGEGIKIEEKEKSC